MTILEKLERAVERATGESVEVLRNRSLEEHRRLAETRHGRSMRVASAVQELLTHEQVEAALDDALGAEKLPP